MKTLQAHAITTTNSQVRRALESQFLLLQTHTHVAKRKHLVIAVLLHIGLVISNMAVV